MTTAPDLVEHVTRFGRTLRTRMIPVGVGDLQDATVALSLVNVADVNEVRIALRISLKVQRRQWRAFDAAFEEWWTGASSRPPATPPPRAPLPRSPLLHGWRATRALQAVQAETAVETAEGEHPGYSPDVLLRRKPFDECSAEDLAAMERMLDRRMSRIATRRSRRLVPTRGKGIADLRRSFRRALSTGGELVSLAHRRRAIAEAELVVLCDTSGSMDVHTRFVLAFVISLKRVARRTEVFAFNTSLVRLTTWLQRGRIDVTLDRLAAGVPDWSGGTKIGESLTTFVDRYLPSFVTSRTIVAIVSDGLDRGDTTLVADAMRAIRARARKVVWLNPLAGDERYEPTARAMHAALPFVDRLAPAHNLESLERLLSELET